MSSRITPAVALLVAAAAVGFLVAINVQAATANSAASNGTVQTTAPAGTEVSGTPGTASATSPVDAGQPTGGIDSGTSGPLTGKPTTGVVKDYPIGGSTK